MRLSPFTPLSPFNTFGDIFRGERYVGRIIGAGFLMILVVSVGYVLCIVPGIILALMLSQFLWLIVDRDAGAVESLTLSNQLTTGNKLNLFLLMLIVFAISLVAGFIPFGFIFSTPFIWLQMAVTYLRLTGQSTADMLAPQPR